MIWMILIVGLVGVDQLLKLWVLRALKPVGTIGLIPNFLHLTYAENTGAAFSSFDGMRWLLVGVTGAVLLLLVVLILSKRIREPFSLICLSLIVAGGIGNLLDRIFRGFVIDYIDFRAINYAIFNFADSCVCVGAVLLCIYIIVTDIKKSKRKKETKEQA